MELKTRRTTNSVKFYNRNLKAADFQKRDEDQITPSNHSLLTAKTQRKKDNYHVVGDGVGLSGQRPLQARPEFAAEHGGNGSQMDDQIAKRLSVDSASNPRFKRHFLEKKELMATGRLENGNHYSN